MRTILLHVNVELPDDSPYTVDQVEAELNEAIRRQAMLTTALGTAVIAMAEEV